LFEKISLEGAQSGLSWLTILRKREAYRRVFHNFDVDRVAAMTQEDVERVLQEEDVENTRNIIVRHRGKIEAVINNAQCIQQMWRKEEQKRGDDDHKQGNHDGVLDALLWSFVQDQPLLNSWNGQLSDAPSQTVESQAMSKALKKLGFKFVGPTTCYAMMQSLGMVIDHPVDSPEWKAAQERLNKRPGGFQER
jgi:DNA-3-methyladenine glycosylase I